MLAKILTLPTSGVIDVIGHYRRYQANIRSSVIIDDNHDTSIKHILYQIGRRAASTTAALVRPPPDAAIIEAVVDTSPVISQEMSGLARKYSNFAGTFERSNLAGVVERLARSLAVYATHPGHLNTSDIRCGNPLRISALGVHDQPVTAQRNSVFVPRLVDSYLSPNTFSVLASAITGEGGTICSDMVQIDANTRQPIILDVSGGALPYAIVEALRLLGANFAASGAGVLYAYAFTRGIHQVLSVVGHTDEGGIIRDFLRGGSFGVPFGGIHCNLDPYVGIPVLAGVDATSVAGYVDAIAISTAAAVAHCDPGAYHEGRWYPTVVCGTNAGIILEPGQRDDPGAIAAGRSNFDQLMDSLPSFGRDYLRALGLIFQISGDIDCPLGHFLACAQLRGRDSRHLRYPSVAPYFWVEPTSVLDKKAFGTVAEDEGYASKTIRDEVTHYPCFERQCGQVEVDAFRQEYVVGMRSARTSALLCHLHGHRAGGLETITIRQMDPALIIHPGPQADHPVVRDRMLAQLPLSDYLWTRGQSAIPAPAELINLGQLLTIRVTHMSVGQDGYTGAEHVPQKHEMRYNEVSFTSTAPSGIGQAVLGDHASNARRARTTATQVLARSVKRVRLFGVSCMSEAPISFSVPRVDDTNPKVPPSDDLLGHNPARREIALAGPPPGGSHLKAGGKAGFADTTPRPAVVLNQAIGGPAPAPVRGGTGPPVSAAGPQAFGRVRRDQVEPADLPQPERAADALGEAVPPPGAQ